MNEVTWDQAFEYVLGFAVVSVVLALLVGLIGHLIGFWL